MINFDCLTLYALTNELKSLLTGGRVHKVQQPSKYEVLLTIRSQGKNRKLLVSAHPKYFYVAILDYSNRQFTIPQSPPMFCMLLRKHMEGSKILDIKQIDNERILEINFESFNELGDRVLMTLACEMMGKYSNIILYYSHSKIILGCAHNVGELMSTQRELAGGLKYTLPPKQNKISILDINLEEFINMSKAINKKFDVWLSQTFHAISLALANELCFTSKINIIDNKFNFNTIDKVEKLYKITYIFLSEKKFKPSISYNNDLFSVLAYEGYANWQNLNSINEMVDKYYAFQIEKEKIKQIKQNLISKINKEKNRLDKKIVKIDEVLVKAYNADLYREKADILMANINNIDINKTIVTLNDFYNDNKPIAIEIKQGYTASQNAQKYYKLYTKAKNSLNIMLNRKNKELEELKYLDSILSSINLASNLSVLEEINEELNPQNQEKKNKMDKQKIQITKYVSSDNFEIFLGRNNKQNDYLISKLAHPKDIWLHVQNTHGSHIIIKTDHGQKDLSEATLHEAALLAGYFSEGRHSSNVPVIFTLRKNLKKPPGSKPGYVTYSNEKTLYVNPLEEHLSTILPKLQSC